MLAANNPTKAIHLAEHLLSFIPHLKWVHHENASWCQSRNDLLINGFKWELYNVAEDYSEANDIAAENPEKLKELQRLFYIEAVKYNVLPLDNTKDERNTVAGTDTVPPGRHVITLDFNYDGGGAGKGGQATLSVDGNKVASEHIPQIIAYRMSLDETLDIGEDTGTPVSEDYKVPFKFTGKLEKVTVNITERKLSDEELEQYRQGRVRSAIAQ